MSEHNHEHETHHEPFPIIIDRKEYKVDQTTMTGAEAYGPGYDQAQELAGRCAATLEHSLDAGSLQSLTFDRLPNLQPFSQMK
jgi:hypothetical protein